MGAEMDQATFRFVWYYSEKSDIPINLYSEKRSLKVLVWTLDDIVIKPAFTAEMYPVLQTTQTKLPQKNGYCHGS